MIVCIFDHIQWRSALNDFTAHGYEVMWAHAASAKIVPIIATLLQKLHFLWRESPRVPPCGGRLKTGGRGRDRATAHLGP
jgi:hypothetical protein